MTKLIVDSTKLFCSKKKIIFLTEQNYFVRRAYFFLVEKNRFVEGNS